MSKNNQVSSESIHEVVNGQFATIQFDPSGNILDANANFLTTTGYTLNDIKNKHHSMFCEKSFVASSEYKIFWDQLAAGIPQRGEFKRLNKQGKEIWISASYTPVKDDSGKVLTVLKIASDITELKSLANMKQMVDLSPINTMMATKDGLLIYMNENSRKTLKTLEKYLPERVENLIGKSIDIFHKNPEHQRKIIGDERNLPMRSKIHVGPEILDLLVSPITDSTGKYIGPMVTWEIITQRELDAKMMATMKQMVDLSPINTMFSEKNGTLTYMNEASKRTLKKLEKYLPERVETMVGKSIDIFHKNPDHQRRIIGDARNLPLRTKIKVGPETLDLLVSPISDNQGEYLGPVVTWDIITERVQLTATLEETAQQLAAAAEELSATATQLNENSSTTLQQSNTAAANTEEVSKGVQIVATNTEEMVASIKEISRNTSEAADISKETMKRTQDTNKTITQLGISSEEIGNVIKVISSIAQQTNLLALNATIEAARAGEAGKGFAVVANEVKELAKQTAKATDDITNRINAIQGDTKDAVSAINGISQVIEKLNMISVAIAAAVEEQTATANEVSRVVKESNKGVEGIAEVVRNVSSAAKQSAVGSSQTLEAAKSLAELAEKIKLLVKSIGV
jgi:methyl-accepting chemotaxis protein